MPRVFFCSALAVLFFPLMQVLAAPIYVYKEKDGVVRFSTKPPPKGVKAEVFTSRKGQYSRYTLGPRIGRLFRDRYLEIINRNAKAFGIERALVQAVIHAESAFQLKAVSPKGAKGLMQIMPSNFSRLKIKDPFDPEQNIQGGVRLLAILHKKYRGDLRLMLAAYNAGEEAVSKYGGVPPYRETQQYVPKVIQLYHLYK